MTPMNSIGKTLDSPPPQEMRGRLMRLPVRERVEIILDRPDAEAVAAGLAVEDYYITLQEMGPDDSLPLLALATVPQLNYLFDMQWWEKDEVQPAAALGWLERLAMAREGKLASWLYEADFELLVVLFKKWLIVQVVPEDTDLAEARDSLPKGTLDDHYFWEARYPQYEDLLKQILSFLFEVNYGFYRELMHSVVWALDAEIEEDAYRFHKGRIEDRAIPDYYEALEIYGGMRIEEVARRGKAIEEGAAAESVPDFAVAAVPEGDLLSEILRELHEPVIIDSIQLELASLSNKVVVADVIARDNPSALRQAVEKAVAYVNLGLELMSGGDRNMAVRIAADVFLEDLFRLAHGRIADIKGSMAEVQQRGWLSRWPTGIGLLDAEWMEKAELLLGKTPRILRSTPGTPGHAFEDYFRYPRDLAEGVRIARIVEHAGVLYESVRVDPGSLEETLWDGGQIPDLSGVTLGSLLWTAAARQLLDGRWDASPLPLIRWHSAFRVLTKQAVQGTILARVAELELEDEKRALLSAYLDPLFRSYEEEMTPFSAGSAPDPATVRFFLFAGR